MKNEAKIIESFRKRGILIHVDTYRTLRNEISNKINYLKNNIKIDVSSYEKRFNMLKSKAINTASLIKKGDQEFIKGITSIIKDLENLKNEINKIYLNAIKIEENLKKLEELYNSGKISEKVYNRLKREYLAKINKVSSPAEEEMKTVIRKQNP